MSLDISADLTELGRTPVTVVCAGVKSILDISRTLEFLETQGVPVITLGPANSEFPAFFTRHSGTASPAIVSSVEGCARVIMANEQYGLCNGIVIAVPIPSEHAVDGAEVENAIRQVLGTFMYHYGPIYYGVCYTSVANLL